MICSSCGTENRSGRKFCSQCAAPLAVGCPVCGAANEPGDRFCGECASALAPTGQPATDASAFAAPAPAVPSAERRLVSVLFADLVGFTTLSESRDAEEVRELLTRYFDTCRTIVARYGGTIEKFIGDAVMAVWGTPVAREDDAERAVRAALELVSAVAGPDPGAEDLAARAAVVTGEAAVTVGAEGQGMVAGDLVNTASRVQSVAEPGTVLVAEATRRAAEAAVAFEDAGVHELKGKAEPVPLWRALRVVGGVRGSLRSAGLESPFVGRDRELRLVKDLFHATADEGTAHLVSVTGIAGIGKSRLAWEFFKYIDGLVDDVWWHRGRCIAYGEGVTYWALAEMVRMRARIAEEEDQASAAAKLAATLEDLITDTEERGWVYPRLAHLLSLEEPTTTQREELFAAWRLLFERMADRSPVAMVFEDLQWADEAMLDFIEHLLDWSRSHPIFVFTLARPELLERRPNWGAGRSGFTALALGPLADRAMDDLLRGMVPGLPDELRSAIRGRAEGVPLYAVETVRMLLDRGLLRQVGARFEPTGPIDELEVPETLQALIASRLDGLSAEERSLLQDASVLGKMFYREALAAVSGRPEDEVGRWLDSLVHKEVLGIQTDPRSPERGQYGFLQSLVQKVAYETLSKRDRKAKHLAMASYIEESWRGDEDEIVEVVASHYLEAYRLAPKADGADEIRAKARGTLERAGRRAESLAARRLAQGYYLRAAELTDEPADRARLTERAGMMWYLDERHTEAKALLEDAAAQYETLGMTHDAARASAKVGVLLWWAENRIEEAIERLERAFEVLSGEEPDADVATVAAELGRLHYFAGHLDRAGDRIERALEIAEPLWLPDVLSHALNTKALVLQSKGRHEEGIALMKHALEVALACGDLDAANRAFTNLSYFMLRADRYDEAIEIERQGIDHARRFGLPPTKGFFFPHMVWVHFATGRWDEAQELAAQVPTPEEEPSVRYFWSAVAWALARIAVERGEIAEAERLSELYREWLDSADVQSREISRTLHALALNARGRRQEALGSALVALGASSELGYSAGEPRDAFEAACEAALALGDHARVEELVTSVERQPRAGTSPGARAYATRFRARLATARGQDDPAEAAFKAAAGAFRELGSPFCLAQTLLEQGEWLVSRRRDEEARPLLEEAREIFERLRATPWLERVAKLEPDLALA